MSSKSSLHMITHSSKKVYIIFYSLFFTLLKCYLFFKQKIFWVIIADGKIYLTGNGFGTTSCVFKEFFDEKDVVDFTCGGEGYALFLKSKFINNYLLLYFL